jgi:co-chaperonin GroES (HSP10)
MNMKPWGEYVAVTDPPANEQEKRTTSGLYLPETTADVDVVNHGVVLGVGPAVEAPDGFGPGALIVYGHDCGLKLGDDLRFIRADCIIGWEPSPS